MINLKFLERDRRQQLFFCTISICRVDFTHIPLNVDQHMTVSGRNRRTTSLSELTGYLQELCVKLCSGAASSSTMKSPPSRATSTP
jgi:hypothetical protein